jgi:hypothetical protein
MRSTSSAIPVLPLIMEAMGLLAAKRRCSASGRAANMVINGWKDDGAIADGDMSAIYKVKRGNWTHLQLASQL